MKSLFFNSGIRDTKTSLAILILRIAFGGLMLTHGFPKLNNFSNIAPNFMNFMGLSGSLSLGLTIFAELFCAILIMLGVATRITILPLIVTMLVAIFIAHGADPIAKKEMALLYLSAYSAIFISGAGKFSVDAMIRK
jgi:putative oxidoreductase